jgi:hypothetical protein
VEAPYPPFRADPNKDTKDNAVAFLNWLIESHLRLHEHQMGQARYLRAIYEMLWNAGLRPGQPQTPSHQPSAPQMPDGVRQAFDWAKENAGTFRILIDAFLGGRR